MTLIKFIKNYSLIFILPFFSIFCTSNQVLAQEVGDVYLSCNKDPVSGVIQIDSERCWTSPDQYKLIVYEIGLCSRDISFTATSTESVFKELNEFCEVVYLSDGKEVILTGTNGGTLGGGATLPPPDTYSYAYVRISNVIGVSGEWKFDKKVTDSSGNPPDNNCWTRSTTFPFLSSDSFNYAFRNNAVDASLPLITECGSGVPSASMLSIAYDTFDGGAGKEGLEDVEGDYKPQLFLDLPGINVGDTRTNIKFMLIDNAGELSTNPTNILYFADLGPRALTIDENTSFLTLEINNSRGALVYFYNFEGDPASVNFIAPGSFLLNITKN